MQPLEEKVASFVRAHGLFAGAGDIVLAVSGGADSIALLYAMHALISARCIDARLIVAHVNHQLRGPQSDGDQAFVLEQSDELNVPVVVKSVAVASYAKTHKLSVEMAGRDLRLACLAEIARACHCTWIATGHQKNDNAETLVQRLARGTGFRGLAGIRPWRPWNDELKLASPLLDCTRDEIVAYLQGLGLRWREDRTNADCVHRRNFIRHRLLPALQSRAGGDLVEDLAHLAASAERLHRRVAKQAEHATGQRVACSDRQAVIEAAALARWPEIVAVEVIRTELTRLGCGQRDLTQHHYRGILELARRTAGGGKRALPHGFLAYREGPSVVLQKASTSAPHQETDLPIDVNVPGTSRFGRFRVEARIVERIAADQAQIKSDKDPFKEYLDLDRLALPLGVRYRHDGDRFQPLGMPAEKKVGKFLTTAKVAAGKRPHVLVFHDSRGIVWLCPVRLGQRARVTPQTRRLLELKVTEETDGTEAGEHVEGQT